MGVLDGLRVLDLARYGASTYAGMLLADQGADVVRPAGLRRSGCPAVWSRGRREVDVERSALQALADRADIVLADPVDGWLPERSTAGIRVRVLGALEDPDLAPRDGPVAAAAGMYENPIAIRPRYTTLRVPAVVGGLYAAIGAIGALLARSRDGRGQEVVVPLADAVVSVLELNALFTIDAPTRWSPIQWAASPFVKAYPAQDGWIYVHLAMPHHAARLVEAVRPFAAAEAEELETLLDEDVLRDPGCVGSVAAASRIVKVLRRVFASDSAVVWETRLSEAGLCATVARTPEAWSEHPHPHETGQLERGPDGVVPGRHILVSGGSGASPSWEGPSPFDAPEGTADDRPPLAGKRVVDLSQVIAGPTAARVLSELGAEVIRLENPQLAAAWVEPFHIAFNAGKSSEWVEREALPTVLGELAPDVVVENFRPGVAERLGVLDAAGEAVVLSISAYGRTGPWGGRPGWEQTAQAAVGMQRDAGAEGPPELYPLPVNDFSTGLSGALAVLLGLLERQRSGRGQRVETSLSGTAVQLLADVYTGGTGRPRGKSLGWMPERHFYRARDGWAFLEADSLAALDGVEGLQGARAAEDPHRLIASRVRGASVETWAARLGEVGTIARRRTTGAVLRDAGLRARGLVRRERHPGIGEVTLIGSALQLERTPLRDLEAAAPRGGGSMEVPVAASPSKLAWLFTQVRWVLFLVRNR